MAKRTLSPAELETVRDMTPEQRSRYLGPTVANARLAARLRNVDHIAARPARKAAVSPAHYRNLLRCPEVVFARYGVGL